MRIYGPSPTRRLSRGALLGGALLVGVWSWAAIEGRRVAPSSEGAIVSDVMPVHLSLSFKKTRKLAYQRWMINHPEETADPNGMSPVEGTLTAAGKTFITRVRTSGKDAFTLDLAHGDTWNGARSLRLIREGAALREGTPVELDLNGHPEGRFVLVEAPTLNKMLRQGRRLGSLFRLDANGRLTPFESFEDDTNPVFKERRQEALAKVARKDASLFSEPSLVQALKTSKNLIVYYDPDLGRFLPVGPEERVTQ